MVKQKRVKMKELNKLANKVMLCNIPCIAYLYYIMLDPINYETMIYRENFVILGFAVVNLLLFINEVYIESYYMTEINFLHFTSIGK